VTSFHNRFGRSLPENVSRLASLPSLTQLLPCGISYGRVRAHVLVRTPLFIAHIHSSRILGSFRDCKLETPLRKRRSRVSITNEFSAKRQRVSGAIGSIDVSTDSEKRQEYADINAEPRVSPYLSNVRK